MTKDELIREISRYFHELIPFNVFLGMEVREATTAGVSLYLPMRPELVGNVHYGILHGGVTAAVLDVAGGLAASIHTIERLADSEPELLKRRLRKVGTIDLRVDYLRPGVGEWFSATGEVVRQGNKVSVTRMLLASDRGREIALGTATYMVG